jgi:hypothetical protein
LKKKVKPEKKKRTGTIIALIIITGIILAGIFLYNEQKAPTQNGWITSGPFAINKNQYKLGENVFMVVIGLKPDDVGQMVIMDPKGGTFSTVPFNGTMKSSFNYYFTPNTERIEKLCKPTDLVGNWTIIFKGVRYKSIPFEIVNDWIPGSQAQIKPIDPC